MMSEASAINDTPTFRTRESLAADLRALGVGPGMTVLVHSSLSSLGWVCGGPVAVIQALLDALTPTGTLVMPAHSGDYSDPSFWENPPVPRAWWRDIRRTMPAFDPNITPTDGVGIIAETFRKWPGVLRSSHPDGSFCALGPLAREITANHSLDNTFGERSPVARIYDLDGWVLMLGTGYDTNTSFHLAEYRVPNPRPFYCGAPVIRDSKRVWKIFVDVWFNAEFFPDIGEEFDGLGHVRRGKVGSADCRLFPQRPAVDFAQKWLARKRFGQTQREE